MLTETYKSLKIYISPSLYFSYTLSHNLSFHLFLRVVQDQYKCLYRVLKLAHESQNVYGNVGDVSRPS